MGDLNDYDCGFQDGASHQRKKIRAAADAILAPMTGEFGRIMEEAPDQEIELTLCSRTVRIPASKFMALYHATDT